jgi:hypothetical protein
MITAQESKRESRAIRRPFFGYVDLKKKRILKVVWSLASRMSGFLLILAQNTCRMTHLLARFSSLQMRLRAFCRIWMSIRVPAPVCVLFYADDMKLFLPVSGFQDQGWTGHSGKETLVAVAFPISHTKCQKRGLLDFFCMEYRRGLLNPVHLCPGLFENSVGSEQTVRVVRQKLIAPQRW